MDLFLCTDDGNLTESQYAEALLLAAGLAKRLLEEHRDKLEEKPSGPDDYEIDMDALEKLAAYAPGKEYVGGVEEVNVAEEGATGTESGGEAGKEGCEVPAPSSEKEEMAPAEDDTSFQKETHGEALDEAPASEVEQGKEQERSVEEGEEEHAKVEQSKGQEPAEHCAEQDMLHECKDRESVDGQKEQATTEECRGEDILRHNKEEETSEDRRGEDILRQGKEEETSEDHREREVRDRNAEQETVEERKEEEIIDRGKEQDIVERGKEQESAEERKEREAERLQQRHTDDPGPASHVLESDHAMVDVEQQAGEGKVPEAGESHSVAPPAGGEIPPSSVKADNGERKEDAESKASRMAPETAEALLDETADILRVLRGCMEVRVGAEPSYEQLALATQGYANMMKLMEHVAPKDVCSQEGVREAMYTWGGKARPDKQAGEKDEENKQAAAAPGPKPRLRTKVTPSVAERTAAAARAIVAKREAAAVAHGLSAKVARTSAEATPRSGLGGSGLYVEEQGPQMVTPTTAGRTFAGGVANPMDPQQTSPRMRRLPGRPPKVPMLGSRGFSISPSGPQQQGTPAGFEALGSSSGQQVPGGTSPFAPQRTLQATLGSTPAQQAMSAAELAQALTSKQDQASQQNLSSQQMETLRQLKAFNHMSPTQKIRIQQEMALLQHKQNLQVLASRNQLSTIQLQQWLHILHHEHKQTVAQQQRQQFGQAPPRGANPQHQQLVMQQQRLVQLHNTPSRGAPHPNVQHILAGFNTRLNNAAVLPAQHASVVYPVACDSCSQVVHGTEGLLVCDWCEKAYHAACLPPAFQAVGNNDWFCPRCSASQPPPPSKYGPIRDRAPQNLAPGSAAPRTSAPPLPPPAGSRQPGTELPPGGTPLLQAHQQQQQQLLLQRQAVGLANLGGVGRGGVASGGPTAIRGTGSAVRLQGLAGNPLSAMAPAGQVKSHADAHAAVHAHAQQVRAAQAQAQALAARARMDAGAPLPTGAIRQPSAPVETVWGGGISTAAAPAPPTEMTPVPSQAFTPPTQAPLPSTHPAQVAAQGTIQPTPTAPIPRPSLQAEVVQTLQPQASGQVGSGAPPLPLPGVVAGPGGVVAGLPVEASGGPGEAGKGVHVWGGVVEAEKVGAAAEAGTGRVGSVWGAASNAGRTDTSAGSGAVVAQAPPGAGSEVVAVAKANWLGSPVKIEEGNVYYLSCQFGGVVYRVNGFAQFWADNPTDPPYIARLQELWEDKDGEQYVRVSWCFHAHELGQSADKLPPSEPNEVYESNHTDVNPVGSIQGPCKVLGPNDYHAELAERAALSAQGQPVANMPVHMRRWLYNVQTTNFTEAVYS